MFRQGICGKHRITQADGSGGAVAEQVQGGDIGMTGKVAADLA